MVIMSMNSFSLTPILSSPTFSSIKIEPKKNYNSNLHFYSSSPTFKCRLAVSFEDIAAITQNKVLIAAGISAAIGQFSKPFTSVLLYGNSFDFKAIVQAGGFPSTHSSAVVATATSLALERGFSDSIFGLTLVYAGLVMYDAQGVRREVGLHAKTINRALLVGRLKLLTEGEGEEEINSIQGKPSSANMGRSSVVSEEANKIENEQINAPLLLGSRLQKNATNLGNETKNTGSYTLLKETVGHTEVEVIAGALLGFLVSLTVQAIV